MKPVLIIYFSLFFSIAFAQEHYVFSPIDINDGLSGNKVRCISQLSDGRMVIVTEGLINLYDGTSFHYLHYNDETVFHLTAYFGYHHPYVDDENRLWIKDYQKLMMFDLKKENFVPNLDSLFQTEGVHSPVADFFMDSNRNLWYLTNDDELLYRSSETKTASVFISDFSHLTNQDKLYDLAVYETRVFLFFQSGMMICFDLNTKKELYRENPFTMEGKGLYERTSLVVAHKQFLYQIRNGSSGILLRYDVENRKWKTILKQDYTFNTLSVDLKGNLWVSSSHGLWYVNNDLQEEYYIPELHLVDGRVFRTEISTQYSDNQGGFWIGTSNRGILYYHPERFKFRNIGKTLFQTDNEQELKVTCLAEYQNKILVGTSNGLFLFDRERERLFRLSGLPPNIQCFQLLKDRQQRIWLCAGYDGLYCLDGIQIQHFPFPNKRILSIHESKQGVFYLGSEKGFGLFEPLTGAFQQTEQTAHPMLNQIYRLIDYGDESLMGLSNTRLFTYDCKQDLLYIPDKEENRTEMFKQNNHQVNDLFIDSRNLIWFATQDGLNVWNPNLNRMTPFRTENGLVNNSVQSVIEDAQNRIWVSTACGISCIDIHSDADEYQYVFTNFNSYDGVIGTEFVGRSVVNTSNSSILWGGMDGFNEIDLNRIDKGKQLLSKPLFVRFFLFGTEIKQGESYDGNLLLNQSIAATNQLNLLYNQNFFTLEFSALNYVNPMQTFYRYKLEGIDDDWHETMTTSGMGRANYTGLPAGTYILKVQAAHNGQEWNDEYAEMKIVITPPWWKTSFAYGLYLIVGLLMIYLFISYYLKWNKQKIIRQQKEQLEWMKYRFFTNVSHELRTPLTLILTPLDAILKKMKDESLKEQLTGIYKNASDLLKIVNQLLDFRKIEMKGETLRLNYCDLNEFVKTVVSPFQLLAQNKEIEFVIHCNAEHLHAFVDKDKLQKMVNNLLSNACKFTPKGGQISLLMDKNEQLDEFFVQISDTGCGIPEKELGKIFERFYQLDNQDDQNTGSGIGLHIVQEYIQLHRGRIQVESKLNEGSVFTLFIPLALKSENKEDVTSVKSEKESLQLLVIEDNDEFRSFLFNQLSELYSVKTASDGQDGLNKAMEYTPDLIISDVRMPQMDGVTLCKTLKQEVKTSHIPIILLTAHSSEEAQIEGYEAGADAYISKPFSMDILFLRIQNLLEQQKNRKELFKQAIVIQPQSLTTTSLDEQLLKKALQCIEKNLNNPLYSVEHLSKDMNMDRTGLYRKLLAISGQTPSSFIRTIRLKHAAQLLQQNFSVSEVSEKVGFGAVSYFSKCFQDEFGVKPSQYK